MTTVRKRQRTDTLRMRVDGKLFWAVLVCLVSASPMLAQDRPVHWHHAGAMPPGAIGRQRLLRGGPLSGYCQSVEIRVPQGARVAPAVRAGFRREADGNLPTQNESHRLSAIGYRPEDTISGRSHADSRQPTADSLAASKSYSAARLSNRLLVGLQIGPVYRLKVTDIPNHPGLEVFPTVELVDRLYPPPGQALRFPIPVELTQSELVMAAEGHFVTRVIYLEDPTAALPIASSDAEQRWIEARPGDDPLVTADHLGRPMAIVRIGGRVPDASNPDDDFLYGAQPAMVYDQPARQPRKQ